METMINILSVVAILFAVAGITIFFTMGGIHNLIIGIASAYLSKAMRDGNNI